MDNQEIEKILNEFHVPAHVRRHCEAVNGFTLKLAGGLKEAGENIDFDSLKAASLLHDLARIIDFKDFEPEKFPDPVTGEDIKVWEELRRKYAGRDHADAAAEILESRGYRKIADLVRKHKYLQIEKGFNGWEEKILYYADKRAKHGKIVLLRERLEEGQRRNAPQTIGTEESQRIRRKIYALEREIFTKIGREI